MTVTVVLLGVWLTVTVFAHPIATFVAEVLTQIELRWLAGDMPWTP